MVGTFLLMVQLLYKRRDAVQERSEISHRNYTRVYFAIRFCNSLIESSREPYAARKVLVDAAFM